MNFHGPRPFFVLRAGADPGAQGNQGSPRPLQKLTPLCCAILHFWSIPTYNCPMLDPAPPPGSRPQLGGIRACAHVSPDTRNAVCLTPLTVSDSPNPDARPALRADKHGSPTQTPQHGISSSGHQSLVECVGFWACCSNFKSIKVCQFSVGFWIKGLDSGLSQDPTRGGGQLFGGVSRPLASD